MGIANTADYDELVLEVEFTPESGVFTKVCGLTDISINRSKSVQTQEVPDCGSDSLAFHIRRLTTSKDVTISGTGVWALDNHQDVFDWYNDDTTKLVRVTNTKAESEGAAGVVFAETIPMKMLSLKNDRKKGVVVSAEVEFGKDGAESLTAVA